MRVKLISFSFLIFCCCISIKGFAQFHHVEGMVTDSSTGDPVQGASIHVEGTDRGAITDANGSYSIKNVSADDSLIISCIGYRPQMIKASNRTTINIQLQPAAETLDKVVVVGFGIQQKETVTGAVVSMNNKELLKAPVSNISNALAGRLPGLITQQQSGEPGYDESSLKIRGISTLSEGSGSAPLIVIDGVPRDRMNLLNPHDIKSITVLKDASATAVYGVRGANGVILITTRAGTQGKPTISFNTSLSGQVPTRLPEFLTSYDYAVLRNEGARNDGLPEPFTPDMLKIFKHRTNPVLYPNHNWAKEFMKPVSLQHQDNLTVSGGTDVVRYFLSMGYFVQQGAYHVPSDLSSNLNLGYNPNPQLKRYNFRANIDVNITKTLSASFRLGYIQKNTNYPGRSTGDIMFAYMSLPPFSGVGVLDGKLIAGYLNDPLQAAGIQGRGNSPYALILNDGYQTNSDFNLNTNVELKQTLDFITKGLSTKLKFAYDDYLSHHVRRNKAINQYAVYFDADSPDGYAVVKTSDEGNFSTSESQNMTRDVYLEYSIDYHRRFGEHNITGLILYNQIKNHDPDFQYEVPEAIQGLVGRVTYNYKEKYLAEFNAGYNGSENFPKGRRFGFFPAYSVGWVPSREEFFPRNNIITFMKIRGSYGVVGNDKIGGDRFLYLPSTYSFRNGSNDGYYFGMYGTNLQHYTGSREESIGNPFVTWERAAKYDVGLELRLFKDKLSFEGDYFKEKRNNILIKLGTVPAIVAADLPAVNKGQVENHGFELQAKWSDKVGPFTYWIGGNMSFARDKAIFDGSPVPADKWLSTNGVPVGQNMAKRSDGLYNGIKEVNNRPFYSFGGNLVQPGDISYIDINGDGIIDFHDVVPTGYGNYPEITWGAPVGVQYKGIELTALLQGASHIDGFWSGMLASAFQWGWRSALAENKNRWSQERYDKGEKITMPRVSAQSNTTPNDAETSGQSDFWMIDRSYVRLKNIQISYSFGGDALEKIGIKTMRVYVSGNNLITLSDMKFLDPERESGNRISYPIMKVFSAGINLNF